MSLDGYGFCKSDGVRVPAPIAFVAFAIGFPVRVWRRARRDRTSVGEALQALADDAWEQMTPQMKAEIDPSRAAREANRDP
jgi:hypothetical protein